MVSNKSAPDLNRGYVILRMVPLLNCSGLKVGERSSTSAVISRWIT